MISGGARIFGGLIPTSVGTAAGWGGPAGKRSGARHDEPDSDLNWTTRVWNRGAGNLRPWGESLDSAFLLRLDRVWESKFWVAIMGALSGSDREARGGLPTRPGGPGPMLGTMSDEPAWRLAPVSLVAPGLRRVPRFASIRKPTLTNYQRLLMPPGDS
jgi:hypothetical protein